MTFADKLNEYIEILQCTGGDLANAAGISESILSRYRSGKRLPSAGSENVWRLAEGIARLAAERSLTELDPEAINEELGMLLTGGVPADFQEKFNQLLNTLDINAAQMAKAINYDASFLSRLRSGKRFPANPSQFIRQLAPYLMFRYSDKESLKLLAELTGSEPEILSAPDGLTNALLMWFYKDHARSCEARQNDEVRVLHFLREMDAFDLNNYIRAIRFGDELEAAEFPPLEVPRFFAGVGGQKSAELAFLNAVASSASKEPLLMYSDMDMSDMSEDREFSKAWMYGLAMVLKERRPIIIIHNLNRPFPELMLGLEAYIPLYMTGIVSPYYLKGVQSNTFRHFLYTTEEYALAGEAIAGFHDQARFLLTKDRFDVEYYRNRSKYLLQKALPLMEIFTAEKQSRYEKFRAGCRTESGNRHMISSALPVFVLPSDSLERILGSSGFSEDEIALFRDDAARQREDMEHLLEHSTVLDELPLLERDEFEQHPPALLFFHTFVERTVTYSYEEYILHLEAAEKYAAVHPRYRILLRRDFIFRNIHIDILQGKWVWISKHTSPSIHFVIYHPKLREAIEKLYAAATED